MLIAKEKRKTNIIEYLLYLYQIEDIIRSFNFDIQAIDQAIVQQYDQPDTIKTEIRKWYQNLILAMRSQNIEQKGHLQELRDLISELHYLHQIVRVRSQFQIFLPSGFSVFANELHYVYKVVFFRALLQKLFPGLLAQGLDKSGYIP